MSYLTLLVTQQRASSHSTLLPRIDHRTNESSNQAASQSSRICIEREHVEEIKVTEIDKCFLTLNLKWNYIYTYYCVNLRDYFRNIINLFKVNYNVLNISIRIHNNLYLMLCAVSKEFLNNHYLMRYATIIWVLSDYTFS